jgi:hypothetical protein
MSKEEKKEDAKSKIKTKNCPKCGEKTVPQVGVRYKANTRHEPMKKLTRTPFFEHVDVYYIM